MRLAIAQLDVLDRSCAKLLIFVGCFILRSRAVSYMVPLPYSIVFPVNHNVHLATNKVLTCRCPETLNRACV